MSSVAWPSAGPIETERLRLEPLRPDHADEMAPVLDDPSLHGFIGGRPATLDELRSRYIRQTVGSSPDRSEGWLNWIVRLRSTGEPAGTVQATLRRMGPGVCAEVAWVVATPHQRQGIASEASLAMVAWLRDHRVDRIAALIHPDHVASANVARRLSLTATDELVDGEVRWVSDASGSGVTA